MKGNREKPAITVEKNTPMTHEIGVLHGEQLAKDVVNQTIGPEFVDLGVKETQSNTKERYISPKINLGNGKKISEAQRITKYLKH